MRITTAAEAAQRDADAIAGGVESWALMHTAGQTAAGFLMHLAGRFENRCFVVLAGSGNNGGDAYVIAAELLNAGETVHLTAVSEPRTADAKRAKGLYEQARALRGPPPDLMATSESQQVFYVDGLLGTGQHGALRAPERELTERVNASLVHGAIVVALDLPTGVNATTGDIAEGALWAHHTLALGTMKRAHVLEREQCGQITVLDIGPGDFPATHDDAWVLADELLVSQYLPRTLWNAHKGTRGKLAIVGGSRGMAGAIVLAAEAAIRSGVGLVHTHVHADSVLTLQISVPQAITHGWDDGPISAQALAVGPGFGRNIESLRVLEALMRNLPGIPLVLDADALTIVGPDVKRLKSMSKRHQVVCTPHVGEFARLLGVDPARSLDGRVQQAMELAGRTGATILLKGTPNVVVSPDNAQVIVVPRGTSVLATGGSGDMLTGVIGTLLAQGASPARAATVGAWVHGRAAEIATERGGTVRGVTLHDVLTAMPAAWREVVTPNVGGVEAAGYPVLASLPRVSSEHVW